MKKYIHLLVCFFLSTNLFAQSKADLNPCGTPAHKSSWLQAYQENLESYFRGNGVTMYVPLTIHSVGNDAGSGHMRLLYILRALCTLNTDFAPSNIQFYIEGEILMHNNSYWYAHDWDGGTEMMNEARVDNTINCYIVNDPAGNCGYAWWNSVALAKSCITNGDHTWAHEIGHHMSLPHTFFGWEGFDLDYGQNAPAEVGTPVEKVDGSNCAFAADGFCDTPPDYLNYRWGCDGNNFSLTDQHDPDGVAFNSDGTYFMSYSSDECASRFSPEQMGAMLAYLYDEEPELLENQNPLSIIEEPSVIIYPEEEDLVSPYQLTFSWEEIAGAEAYYLQVSKFIDFGNTVYNGLVSTNSITLDLQGDKQYYWRLKAYNSYSFCSPETAISTFFTLDEQTNTTELFETDINVFPNLVAKGEGYKHCFFKSSFDKF